MSDETVVVKTTWQVVAVDPIEIPPNGWGIPSKIPVGWRSAVYDQEPSFFRGAWLVANGVSVPAEGLRIEKTTQTIVTRVSSETVVQRWIPTGMFGGKFEPA